MATNVPDPNHNEEGTSIISDDPLEGSAKAIEELMTNKSKLDDDKDDDVSKDKEDIVRYWSCQVNEEAYAALSDGPDHHEARHAMDSLTSMIVDPIADRRHFAHVYEKAQLIDTAKTDANTYVVFRDYVENDLKKYLPKSPLGRQTLMGGLSLLWHRTVMLVRKLYICEWQITRLNGMVQKAMFGAMVEGQPRNLSITLHDPSPVSKVAFGNLQVENYQLRVDNTALEGEIEALKAQLQAAGISTDNDVSSDKKRKLS